MGIAVPHLTQIGRTYTVPLPATPHITWTTGFTTGPSVQPGGR
jgi:hypothetical protein